ncbi:23S rRNA (uracil(1939)-C(5))-methyltransferase [Handroanthus impetiginosus]|uniref:23S rRNA (Uracil(1939)-C(5))-methyltransferase n=1 Tax=Handroanthus impetiginosus TaxID=429701 RepID=A0A2G9GAK8_9LAMI|nr:23S rRNA (uracil(1939)-C(5))-methyltransferase [Handroanthus impetiginosus]
MAAAISLLSLPPRASSSFFTSVTCRTTSPSITPNLSPSPPPPQPLLLPPEPKTNPVSSSSCSLHCRHFQSCSGCTHEHNLHQPPILNEAVEFFRNIGVSNFTFDSCRLWGWRCRAKLAVRGSAMEPLIGLYEEGTHNVVDIPECKAHHPSITAAVDLLKQAMVELNIEPYDEDKRTGELRYVQMAVTTYNTSLPATERYKNGKVQVALVWNSRNENSPSFEKLNALAKCIWIKGGPKREVHLIHSVWANFQTSTNNIIFGNRWRHLFGERDFWEHVGGIDVSMVPSSFGQANTRAFDSLLHKLQKYVPYGASVVDLYAGAGVIGLSLAATRKCRSVKCVEVNKEAKLSFEKTVSRLPATLDSSISWHLADTSKEPLSWLMGSDVVVVDPPRKGLDPSLLNALQSLSSMKLKDNLGESTKRKIRTEKRPWILRERDTSVQINSQMEQDTSPSLPQTLLYISCGWDSFKEDCMSLLSSKAWHLDKAHGFNFFPGTHSIEILAVFRRGSGVNIKRKKSGKKRRPT